MADELQYPPVHLRGVGERHQPQGAAGSTTVMPCAATGNSDFDERPDVRPPSAGIQALERQRRLADEAIVPVVVDHSITTAPDARRPRENHGADGGGASESRRTTETGVDEGVTYASRQ